MTRALLAIETSCDETAAAVVTDRLQALSSVVSSQVELHARFGGVVPEIASRAHVRLVGPIVSQALDEARVTAGELSAVAVTRGPGLVGALLVGISAAKALAMGLGLPIVAVNHLEGHLASVAMDEPDMAFPQLALLVSGGHCILARSPSPGVYERLGQTKDDSVGEAYDKVGRLLGLGYPGGPAIDRLAASGEDSLGFPRPMLREGYDFSFSGLKTAVANYVRANPTLVVEDVAASFAAACMDVRCAKLSRALEEFKDPVVSVVGGVAASPILRSRAAELAKDAGARLLLPSQRLATDNAAMIGIAAWQLLDRRGGLGDRFDFGPLASWPLSWGDRDGGTLGGVSWDAGAPTP